MKPSSSFTGDSTAQLDIAADLTVLIEWIIEWDNLPPPMAQSKELREGAHSVLALGVFLGHLLDSLQIGWIFSNICNTPGLPMQHVHVDIRVSTLVALFSLSISTNQKEKRETKIEGPSKFFLTI